MECSLLARRPCRFGGARRPLAWCRRRPAALTAPRRAALVTSRALRGVFWHVGAWQGRQEARLPCLRPRACGRARQAQRSSARVFELAAGDEPAWLVARREPVQHALGMLYSIANSLGGSTGPGRAGSDAMARSISTPRLSALRSGRRQRACAARRSTEGCSPAFQQHLLSRFSRCCLLYTSPSPRDATLSRMPSSA